MSFSFHPSFHSLPCIVLGPIFRCAVEHTFNAKSADLVKVRVVDMCIHAEQPSEDGLCDLHKLRREPDSCLCQLCHLAYGLVTPIEVHGVA